MDVRPGAGRLSDLPALDCNGCRKCCLGDLVPIEPGDDPSVRRQVKHGRTYIAHDKVGNCVYLGSRSEGCKIHQTLQPACCRRYDCRDHFLQKALSGPQAVAARLAHPLLGPAFREGMRRVDALQTAALAAAFGG